MKNLKYLFLTLLGALAFVACTEDTREADWSGIQGNGVYFAMDSQTSYMLETNQSSLRIPVERSSAEGDLTVNVALEDESELFAADTKARFVDGETVGYVEIVFDFKSLDAGVAYKLILSLLDKNQMSGYGLEELTFTVKYDPWTYVGKGYYRDGIIGDVFGILTPYAQVECDVYKSDAQENLYRLGNVYNNPEFVGPMFGVDPIMVGADMVREGYITFDVSNPDKVYILDSDIGLNVNSEYGWFTIGSICPENKFDEYNSYGKLVNNIITFDPEGLYLYLPLYQGGYYFPCNIEAKTRIVMPGGVATDPVVNVEYEGVMIDPDTNATAIFNVEMNEDAASVLFAAVDSASDLNAALAGMVDGSIETEAIYNNGEFTYLINDPGEYVGIFLPVSADGTIFGSPVGITFEYSTGGVVPSQFAVEFTVEADETFAYIDVTPNTEKYEYYWDFIPKAGYEEVVAAYGSVEAYSLAFFQYVAQQYGVGIADVMASYATKGLVEDQMVEGLAAGTDYVAYAFCVNMNTGEARSAATIYEFKTLDAQTFDAEYEAMLGTWTVTSKSSEVAGTPMTFELTFAHKKSNIYFDVYGWAGNAQVANYPILATYKSADEENDALFYFTEQFTNTQLNTQYGMTQMALLGRYYDSDTKTYAWVGITGAPCLVGGLNTETTATLNPWTAEYENEDGTTGSVTYSGADIACYILEGDYAGYLLTMSEDFPVGPFTMTKKVETETQSVSTNLFETEMSSIRVAKLNQVNGKLARRNFLANNNCVMVR